MNARVRFNTSDLKAGVAALRGRWPQAVKRSLRRAGNSGRAAMVPLITQDTGLPARRVRGEISVSLVGDRAVRLEIKGGRIPLIDFKARGREPSMGRGRGVSYRLPTGRGLAPNAFIATMSSGHRGVFKRTGKARLPIVELFGPSLVRVFERFVPDGERRAREALITNLRHETQRALSRR